MSHTKVRSILILVILIAIIVGVWYYMTFLKDSSDINGTLVKGAACVYKWADQACKTGVSGVTTLL